MDQFIFGDKSPPATQIYTALCMQAVGSGEGEEGASQDGLTLVIIVNARAQ